MSRRQKASVGKIINDLWIVASSKSVSVYVVANFENLENCTDSNCTD